MSWGKRRKTNATKADYNGFTYDSKLERDYAKFLDELLQADKIQAWERQRKFPLKNMDGKNTLRYVADFIVYDAKGGEHIIEIKGRLLPADKVKYAYFQHVYDRPVHIVKCNYNNKTKSYHYKEDIQHCPWLKLNS